jgi:uncharacterized protein YceH (UPF0502 family)
MLRGPQTVGELKQRSERLQRFESLAQVAETLEGLAGRELVVRLPRRPGQKEERYAQLLGGEDGGETIAEPATVEEGDRVAAIEERVERLERAVDELRAQMAST